MNGSANRFTPRAQQVLALARDEAGRLRHNYLGSEHLLLGLLRLGSSVAVSVLNQSGLDLAQVRAEVEKQVGVGAIGEVQGASPYAPRTKHILALAGHEAAQLNHSYVGTEHLLLGLLGGGGGVALVLLKSLNVDLARVRQEVLRELDPNFGGGSGLDGAGAKT